MPAYDPTVSGGGLVNHAQGGLSFSLPRTHSDRQYQITWGSKGFWCELCALEKKGDPAEVGSPRLGTYWVGDTLPTQPPAIQHMINHVNEV